MEELAKQPWLVVKNEKYGTQNDELKSDRCFWIFRQKNFCKNKTS